MFKINIPITKSTRVEKGKIIVEGIASDPTIDRDEERFSEVAISKMENCINNGAVDIRVEHQDKFFTNVGKWTEAKVMDGNKLYVKGEIDTDLSMGHDIAVSLNKGKELFLSVGGRVMDATYEYAKELGKSIKVYKDVVLEEISILTTPSNYNTSLSITKSVNWDTKQTFQDAYKQELQKSYQDKELGISNMYGVVIKGGPGSERHSEDGRALFITSDGHTKKVGDHVKVKVAHGTPKGKIQSIKGGTAKVEYTTPDGIIRSDTYYSSDLEHAE